MKKDEESMRDYEARLSEMSDRSFLGEIQDVHAKTRRKPGYHDADCAVMEAIMKIRIADRTSFR